MPSYHRDSEFEKRQGGTKIDWKVYNAIFMPKIGEKMKLIIGLLKKTLCFQCDNTYEKIYVDLKDFLASPPVIQKPIPHEPILVYLLVSKRL